MDDKAVVHTIEHGDASELPETNWFYRRLFIFSVTLVAVVTNWWIIYKVADITTLRRIAINDQYIIAFMALIYIVGSGSEDLTRLVTAFRSTKKETVMTAPPPATMTTATAKVTTAPEEGDLPPDQRVKRP